MTQGDISIFWALFGFAFGLWSANLAWRAKIREKATSGFRLPVGGKLYLVREDPMEHGPQCPCPDCYHQRVTHTL